jgi:hypothetical protein
MTVHLRHRDRPCAWVEPRPHSDASLRFRKHGPIRPMREPGLLERIFGRVR